MSARRWRAEMDHCYPVVIRDAEDNVVAMNISDRADARLIAAAPQLLEAAVDLRKMFEAYGLGDIPAREYEALSQAIEKATGSEVSR